jgi:hypothetical protein
MTVTALNFATAKTKLAQISPTAMLLISNELNK